MTSFDVLFLLLLFVVQPVTGRMGWNRLLRRVAAGQPPKRPVLYAHTALVEWLALAVLAAFWVLLDRPWAWLGVHGAAGPGFYVTLAVGVVALLALALSAHRTRRLGAPARREARASFGDLGHFLPQTDRELRAFFGLSVTAGVVEELLYRGFALWALSLWMPLWLAVLLSSLAFGLAHGYQGAGGMLRTGALGLVFALMFLASGSIWVPIVLHVLVDVVQGVQIRELYRDAPGVAGARAA